MLQQEDERFLASRQQARQKRIAFREHLQQEKRETTSTKLESQKKESHVDKAYVPVAEQHSYLEHKEQSLGVPDLSPMIPVSPKEKSSISSKKKKPFIEDIIFCLEQRILSIEKMENRLYSIGLPANDVARIAVIILGINPHHQPKLHLYNQLRKQYGNDQGKEYYYQTVELLNTR